MSYPVKVSVTRSVEEVVQAGDEQVCRLLMTNVVGADEMREILSDRLAARGWRKGADGRFSRKGEAGEDLSVDLEAMTLTAKAAASEAISRTETVDAYADSDDLRRDPSARARLEKKAAEELESRLAIKDEDRAAAKARLEAKSAAAISAGEGARKREMNELMAEVHAEAVKRKAATLGNVVDVDEKVEGDSHSLTITITE